MLNADDAIKALRERGMRITPQRQAVVRALSGDSTHPLAEEIAARVAATTPGVSLSTVYKTLHELAAIGLIRELDAGGVLRFDAEPAHHGHLICPACGAVRDFDPPPAALRQLALAAGVAPSDAHVTLDATCTTCARARSH